LRRQVQDQVEETLRQPRPEGQRDRDQEGGRERDRSRSRGSAEGEDDEDEGTSQSSGLLGMAGSALKGLLSPDDRDWDWGREEAREQSPLAAASTSLVRALKETLSRLVGTLGNLLLTVKGLLQTVVALLRLILVGLREGVTSAFGMVQDGVGGLVGKVTGAATP
jgi:hypothetical protein